jgi:hypothetical protein
MKTIEDIQREIAERKLRFDEACEAARSRPAVTVTRRELVLLEEMCEPRPLRARRTAKSVPSTSVPEWEWIRC